MARVRIMVDEENSADAWWAAAQVDPPPAIRPLIEDPTRTSVEVSLDEAGEIWAWAGLLPGWLSDIEHANHPILWQDIP